MYHNYTENLKPHEVVAYFRKSRTDDPTLSVEEVLAKHESILDEWSIRTLGALIPEENKYREVVSGETIDDRPEVQKVLKLIESPKIKAILIVEIQRLSRGDLEDAGRLIKLIRYTNTLVITPTKTFNLSDEYDRDIFERELKRGNEYLEYQKKIMIRGRQLSVSQGNFLGIPPYGYYKIFVQDGKKTYPTLAINEDEANIVRMIYDLFVNENLGYHTISKKLTELNITPPGVRKNYRNKRPYWASSYVREILTNVHYTGKVRWNYRKNVLVVEDGRVKKTTPTAKFGNYQIYEGKHPAIIPYDMFVIAQERLGKAPRIKPDFTVKNPLVGLLYCECGHSMVYRTYLTKTGEEKNPPRLLCNHQTLCHNGSCMFSELMDMIIIILKQKLAELQIQLENPNDDSIDQHEKVIKSLEKRLEDINAREISQWEAQSDPNLDNRMPPHIFKMLNEKLLKEREEVEKALEIAYNTRPTKVDYQQKIVTVQSAIDALMDNTKDVLVRNALLKNCIERITYKRGSIERAKGKGAFHKFNPSPIELDVKLRI